VPPQSLGQKPSPSRPKNGLALALIIGLLLVIGLVYAIVIGHRGTESKPTVAVTSKPTATAASALIPTQNPSAQPTQSLPATTPLLERDEVITPGSKHDIVKSVDLRAGPGENYERKINHKASDILKRIEYLSVDRSTTVQVIATKGDWAEIQVIEPSWLSESHRGWIPLKAIKPGKPSGLDGFAKMTADYEAAGSKLRIISSTWERTSTQDGAIWHLTIENTGDEAIENPGLITKYSDRYGQVLEANDANYMKRDLVKVLIKPHERRKVKFQEDFSEPVSIIKADKGAIRIDGATLVEKP